jgi:hypothetical protein
VLLLRGGEGVEVRREAWSLDDDTEREPPRAGDLHRAVLVAEQRAREHGLEVQRLHPDLRPRDGHAATIHEPEARGVADLRERDLHPAARLRLDVEFHPRGDLAERLPAVDGQEDLRWEPRDGEPAVVVRVGQRLEGPLDRGDLDARSHDGEAIFLDDAADEPTAGQQHQIDRRLGAGAEREDVAEGLGELRMPDEDLHPPGRDRGRAVRAEGVGDPRRRRVE